MTTTTTARAADSCTCDCACGARIPAPYVVSDAKPVEALVFDEELKWAGEDFWSGVTLLPLDERVVLIERCGKEDWLIIDLVDARQQMTPVRNASTGEAVAWIGGPTDYDVLVQTPAQRVRSERGSRSIWTVYLDLQTALADLAFDFIC